MKKIFLNCLLLCGIFLAAFGVVSLAFSNFSASNPTLVVMGSVLASFRFLPDNKFTRIYAWLVGIGFVAFAAVLAVIVTLKPEKADGSEDAVIVLGCAVIGDRPSNTMVARTEAAYDYYLKNPDAVFVLSGGKGPQENVSEAEAMYKLMIGKGVPAGSLIMEDKATSTTENFKFSKQLLDDRFDGAYKTAFVTNDFHCYRAGKIAVLQGFESISSVQAKTPINAALLCYVREVLAVVKLWIMGN